MSFAPFPARPPPCARCGVRTSRFVTRGDNPNGNARRPFYKCQFGCGGGGGFKVFADLRGNDPANRPCRCGQSSKRQLAGVDARLPWGVHYVCRLGVCDFYDEELATLPDGSKVQVTVPEDQVAYLARILYI